MDIVQAKKLYNLGQYQDSFDAATSILACDSELIDWLQIQANSAMHLKKYDEARIALEKILAINPLDFASLKDLGNLYRIQGDVEQAESYYMKSIDINNTYVPAITNLGTLLFYENRDTDKGINLMQQAINLDKNFLLGWINLANAYYNVHDFNNSFEACKIILKLNLHITEIQVLLCKNLFKQNKLDITKQYCLRFSQINPSCINFYLFLGSISYEENNYIQSEKFFRQALDIDPNVINASYNLAKVLFKQLKYDQAIDQYNQLITSNPKYINSYIGLADIYVHQLENSKAIKCIQTALTFEPNNPELLRTMSTLLMDKGSLKEAKILLMKAIEINPNFAKAYDNLAQVMLDLSSLEEAKFYWKKAISIDKNFERSIFKLSEILFLEGKYDEAIKYLVNNNSERCRTLLLSCILSLGDENKFYKKYHEFSSEQSCNADLGSIVEHSNIIYKNNINSPFCNKSMEYIYKRKIDEALFSNRSLEELIDFFNSEKIQYRAQKTLSEGVQSAGNLFNYNYPFIKEIKDSLEVMIENYKKYFSNSSEGFLRRWPEKYELVAWMISMKNGGFLKPHNHGYGWITGSFYLSLPKLEPSSNAGNIAFTYSGPSFPQNQDLFQTKIEKIETRDICIFPSSLYHYTIPFNGKKERICFVFDLIKK